MRAKPWKKSKLIKKLRANAARADRMLQARKLKAGIRRDIATSARAALRAADALENEYQE